jgi:ABC-2 type transport system permease protein
VPAITMRSIAGEKADGTYDLLLSRPVTLPQIIMGKYLGGLTITVLAILPTIVYAISNYFLALPKGNIDIGATIGSYIGLLFLVSAFTALSIFCSSLTRNPIVSFLLAVFACFISFYGIGAIADISAFYSIEDMIRNWGIESHYEAISRGVLTGKDFLYFFSFTVFFLVLSVGHLGRKHRPRKITLTRYFVMLLVILLINQPFIHGLIDRIDFTGDKRFTISKTTKELIRTIDQDTYITIFLDGNDLPSSFKRLRQAALDMAKDLSSYSHGRLKVNIIDPLQGSSEEQQELTQALINRGLYPTNLSVKTSAGFSQKLIFPGAIVNNAEQEINIQLLQNRTGQSPEQILNNSIQNLEYAFASAISKLNKQETSYIGFTEGHGEPNDLELYDAMHTLMSSNQVGRLNLDSIALADLGKIKIIVITKPTQPFSESDKYKLDYYVRHGGNIIWAIDQIDADLDHLRESGSQPLIGRELNLDDQLFLYGARLNYNMVADLNCTRIPISVGNIGGQSQIELAPWYFFPILMANTDNPIVKNLDGIRTEFIGTIDTLANPAVKKQILLQSSPFTRIINTPQTISLQMVEEQPDPTTFRTKPAPIAVLLEGKFPYLYQNRPTPNGIDNPKDLTNTSISAKMLIFADGDWLLNEVNSKDQSPFPLGWDRYTEQQYANKIFLENLVDYMLNDEQLISLRNREVKLRLLDQAKVKAEKITWQLINVAAPLVLLTIIGLCQQMWRKKKYGKLKR